MINKKEGASCITTHLLFFISPLLLLFCTKFFGYFFGTAILANVVLGYVAEMAGWDWTFILLIIACALSIVFTSFTYKEEKAARK